MTARKQATASTPNKPSGEKKPRTPKKYPPVALAELKPVKMAAADKITVIPGRERSAEQKAVDETVKEVAFEYLAAGSPKLFRDMPVVNYTLPTDKATTVRFMIGKACNLLNCKPKFGRQAWDTEGNEVVSFCAIPRDASQWTDKPKTDELSEDEKNEATANASDADRPEGQRRTDPSEFAGDDA
jgi:hypothetical protein